MAKKKDLIFDLKVDDKQVHAKLKNADTLLKGVRSRAESVTDAMARWGMILTGVNQGLALAQRVAGVMAQAIDVYEKQEKAERKVEQAIKSTGEAAGFTAEELKKVASSLQDITVFGDEEILNEVSAQLLTFTNITGENFVKAQEAVLNLATVLDGDLKSAAIQLGKALNDPKSNLSALSRAGIQFSDEQEALIKNFADTNDLASAQAIILEELGKQYGGQAKAMADTVTGKMKQANNELGDQIEKIGKLAAEIYEPMLERSVQILGGFADMLIPVSSNLDKVKESAVQQRLEFERLVIQYTDLREKSDLTNEEAERYSTIIDDLKSKYPDLLGNLDLQKEKLEDVRDAFAEVRKEIELNIRAQVREASLKDVITEQENLIRGKLMPLQEDLLNARAKLKAIEEGTIEDTYQYDKSLGGAVGRGRSNIGGGAPKKLSEVLNEEIASLNVAIPKLQKQVNAYQEEIDSLLNSMEGFTSSSGSGSGAASGGSGSTSGVKKYSVAFEVDSFGLESNYQDLVQQFEEKYLKKNLEKTKEYFQDMGALKGEAINSYSETALTALDSIEAGSLEFFDQFVIGSRAAKDEWDAVWLAMRNTALRRIAEVITSGLMEKLFSVFNKTETAGGGKKSGGMFGSVLAGAAGFALGGPLGAIIGGGLGSILPFASGGMGIIGERGPEIIAPVKDYSEGQAALISRTVQTVRGSLNGGGGDYTRLINEIKMLRERPVIVQVGDRGAHKIYTVGRSQDRRSKT